MITMASSKSKARLRNVDVRAMVISRGYIMYKERKICFVLFGFPVAKFPKILVSCAWKKALVPSERNKRD